MKSITLEQRFAESANRECLIGLDGTRLSYGALWANAQNLAHSWRAAGLQPGEVVVLSFPNHLSLLVSYLACAVGGFVACPIPDSHHPDMKTKLAGIVRPRLVVNSAPALNLSLFQVPTAGEIGDPARPLLISFSSGLTGDPKPICLSLGGIVGSAASFARLTEMSPATVLYHILPMGYMAGILNCFFAPLMAGATVAEGPLFSPLSMTDFWQRLLSAEANTLSLTPTIAAALCRITTPGPLLDRVRGQLRQAQCTSAPIPPSLHQQFHALFSLPLQNCYGMTEMGGPLTFQTREDSMRGRELSVPIDEVEVRLKNDGELWLRTPYLMLGYRNENGSLELPLDENGFMNTGDTAILNDGKLQITGRKKDIIIRGGVNISPARLESVLAFAPGVAEVAVVGVKHEFWGEAIVACVVPKEAAPGVEKAVKIFSREQLGQHERPDHVLVLEQLPRSFIGKIQKNLLKETAAARLK